MKNNNKDIIRNEKPVIYLKIHTISSSSREQDKILRKQNYSPPKLSFEIVELESCIAANSASLSPGSGSNLNTPYVEDWVDQGSLGNQDIDL
ncbi:hypothetical protein OZ668_15305 [Elizabethkingia sp. HX XZB]|uniref:hypothetical protein n=1 Tax=Elizabethkingia sp. HX XZB TaxID=3003193 RepID=UPI002A23EF46|nr:hypothetical protein [Elizabethkingia sp. HX XZB]MDX8569367.1 hypothetical protein [Elizabethkingia sp. HX XZB]